MGLIYAEIELSNPKESFFDEKSHVVPYVGPVAARFQGRTCFTGALVIGDSVSPNIPSAVVK